MNFVLIIRKKTAAIILLLFFWFSGQGQNFDPKKMDAFFEHVSTYEKGMGAISIFKEGLELYNRAYGFSDMKNKLLNGPKTKFRIGSVSKTFTATIIMQLIDERKINLGTKLSEFFPNIPNSDNITIENLLRHSSGLIDFTQIEDFGHIRTKNQTRNELIEKIKAQTLVFEPGSKEEYSNTNYILLSIIAERLEKQEFGVIVSRRISEPCGLTDTYYGTQIDPKRNEAIGYSNYGGHWIKEEETHYSLPLGAGGIVSNSPDLSRFITKLFKGHLVSEQSLALMKNISERFGLGLYEIPFYEHRWYGHEGAIDGFETALAYYPEREIAIAFCANAISYPRNDILIAALNLIFDKEMQLPKFRKSLKVSGESLNKYIGTYNGPTFPMQVTIKKDDDILIVHAEGEEPFPVEAYENHIFWWEQGQIELKFSLENETLSIGMGGETHVLDKK